MKPILVDADEVLIDFVGEVLNIVHAMTGRRVLYGEITQWDLETATRCPGLDNELTRQIEREELCYRLKEIHAGMAWFRELQQEFGVGRVFVCTSPWNATWKEQRAAWFEDRGLPSEQLIQRKDKHNVPGLLIDDAAHHIERREPGEGFLIARPWNRLQAPRFPRGDYYAATAWLREVAL